MTKGLVTNGLHRPLKMATTVCEGEIRVSDSSKNLKGFRFSNFVTMIPTRFQCRMLNFSVAIFLVASPFLIRERKIRCGMSLRTGTVKATNLSK